MKKRTKFIHMVMLTGVLMIISLVAAGACLAGSITAVHGNSGSVEFMDRFINTDRYKFAWGLDIEQKSGTGNWLHYSIPTIPFTKTRYLLLYYETGVPGFSADSMISAFHVYDGGTRIYQNNSINLTGGPTYTIIDMGEDKTINVGLDLSVLIGAGVGSMSHRIRIYGAWAEFH